MKIFPHVEIPASGNGMKSHDGHDTFIRVSSGDGNRTDDEVHVAFWSKDGDFVQGWFEAGDLVAAIERMRVEKPE